LTIAPTCACGEYILQLFKKLDEYQAGISHGVAYAQQRWRVVAHVEEAVANAAGSPRTSCCIFQPGGGDFARCDAEAVEPLLSRALGEMT
jgi:hypothetical protein